MPAAQPTTPLIGTPRSAQNDNITPESILGRFNEYSDSIIAPFRPSTQIRPRYTPPVWIDTEPTQVSSYGNLGISAIRTFSPISRGTTSVKKVKSKPVSKEACGKCKKEYNANFMKIVPAGKFCSGCFQKYYFQCYRCTEYCDVQKVKLFISEKRYRMCQPCKERSHTVCSGCSVIVRNDDIITIEETPLCHDCARRYYFYCGFCDRNVKGKEYGYFDGDLVCEPCYKAQCYYCLKCKGINRVVYRSKGTCTPCGYIFCYSCLEAHDCNNKDKPRISPEERAARKERQNEVWMKKNNEVLALYHSENPYRAPSYKHYPGTESGRIVTINRLAGIEIEAEEGRILGLAEKLQPEIGIARDGSIQGIEVQTPPCSMNVLEDFVNTTCQALVSKGFRGTKKAGLHVHIDATDFSKDHQKITQVIKTFYAIEDLLFSTLPPSRWVNKYCMRLNKNYLYKTFRKTTNYEEIAKKWYNEANDIRVEEVKRVKYQDTRYHSLNIHSLFYRGTVEIRCHSGTVSPRKILYWTQLLLSIVDYAVNRYDEKQVEALFDMETSSFKLMTMYEAFGINSAVQEYITARTVKFNPDFIVKFNKGKTIRNREKSHSSKIVREYNKNIEKARIELLPQAKKDIASEYSWATTESGDIDWDLPEIKQSLESVLNARATELVSGKLTGDHWSVINNKGEKGFVVEKELNEILRYINIGKGVAVANQESTEDFEE